MQEQPRLPENVLDAAALLEERVDDGRAWRSAGRLQEVTQDGQYGMEGTKLLVMLCRSKKIHKHKAAREDIARQTTPIDQSIPGQWMNWEAKTGGLAFPKQ